MRRPLIAVITGCASLLVLTAGLGSTTVANHTPVPAPITTPVAPAQQVGSVIEPIIEQTTLRVSPQR